VPGCEAWGFSVGRMCVNERDAIRKALGQNPKMARVLKQMLDEGKLKAAGETPDEPLMVICKRWPGLVDDCRMALCSFCGAEVALAPSSQELVDKAKVEVRYCCMECFSEGAVERYEAEQKAKDEAEQRSGGG
jgi:hypothetical protein